MLHWWDQPGTPAAIAAKSEEIKPGEFELTPVNLYKRDERGQTNLAVLTEEQKRRVRSLRATLRANGQGLEGSWRDCDGDCRVRTNRRGRVSSTTIANRRAARSTERRNLAC